MQPRIHPGQVSSGYIDLTEVQINILKSVKETASTEHALLSAFGAEVIEVEEFDRQCQALIDFGYFAVERGSGRAYLTESGELMLERAAQGKTWIVTDWNNEDAPS